MSTSAQGFLSAPAYAVRGRLFDVVKSQRTDLAPQVLEVLRHRREPSVVARAAWALARLGYREVIPELLPLLESPHEDMRKWAAWALGEFGNFDLERPLRAAFEEERSQEVRRAMGGALKKIRMEPTRVHREQLIKELRAPTATALEIRELVDRLEDLRSPDDHDEMVSLRRQIQQSDPTYFKTYMDWVRWQPSLRAALDDPRKTYT